MKEKLYAIPVNDAFSEDCECPVCALYKKLEDDAVDYTMDNSYMQDDTRAITDKLGFCQKHIKMVYNKDNRLGMALVMKTHFDKTIKDVSKLSGQMPKSGSLFKKGVPESGLTDYLNKLNSSCFVCDKINSVFDRYIATIFHLWKNDPQFKDKYLASKGFCNPHFSILLSESVNHLKGDELAAFQKATYDLYITNMERVRDDIAWFINKFDYRYADEPWKNSKDSLPRSMTKADSLL